MGQARLSVRRILRTLLLVVPTAATIGGLPQVAASEGLFAKIKSRGEVTVATEAAYYPFEFVENGKIVGYDEDILNDIIKDWGIKMKQVDLPFAGILPGLLANKYDFVATALLINPERAVKYAFTMPVAASKVGILKRKGDTRVGSVTDFKGLVVGSAPPTGGPPQIFDAYIKSTLKPAGKAPADRKYFPSSADEFQALADHQVDAVVESMPVILGAMHKMPDTFEVVGTFGNPFWIGWVARPEDGDLRDALNVEIKKLRDNGEIARLQKKWLGFEAAPPDTGYLPAGAK
jgi:polar amino acid transport system substrate-binding protein